MRKLMTTVALAAVLGFSSMSVAFAAAPTTGNAIVDEVLAQYYASVDQACAPAGGSADAAACKAALIAFAALTDPAALARVPAIRAAINAGTLTTAELGVLTASTEFTDSFLAANTTLVADIRAANVGNNVFLTAINETSLQTLGFRSAGGGTNEGSATFAG